MRIRGGWMREVHHRGRDGRVAPRQACVPLEVRRGAFGSLAHPIHSPCRGLFELHWVDRHHQYVGCAGTVGLKTDGWLVAEVLRFGCHTVTPLLVALGGRTGVERCAYAVLVLAASRA